MSQVSAQESEGFDSNAGFGTDQESDTEMGQSWSQAEEEDDFTISQSQGSKLPTYSYKCLSFDKIVELRNSAVQDVGALLGVQDAEADILLRHYGWKRDRLTDQWLENSDKVRQESGLAKIPIAIKIAHLPDFECQVCFSTSQDVGTGRRPKMPTFSLSCGHGFCQDCYKQYVETKIGEGDLRIRCLDESCKLKVEEAALKLLLEPDLFDRYKRLLTLSFVEHGLKDVKWCTGPDCENGVQCDILQTYLDVLVPTVICDCKQAFCFGCGESESHQPAVCGLVKKWAKKMKDDSETAKWLQGNTKDCPGKGCGKATEKNGGCNHMTCKCGWEWCWVCSGDWKQHNNNYNCNRPSTENEGKENAKASLARYLHYFDRFNNHDKSAKLELANFARSEEKMEEIQESSALTWIETRYMERGVKVVIECRQTLKWTYAFAFYLVKNNMTELFEDNQRDLERAVEELSYALEKPIEVDTIAALRTEITDLSNYVSTRRKIVLEDAAQGLQEGRLVWGDRG